MELNYKLISKEDLPMEARICLAISNDDFYCWQTKEYLLVNAQAPHLDQALEALRIWWLATYIDGDEAEEGVDKAYKDLMRFWTAAGIRQVFEAWHDAAEQERKKQDEAWSMELMSRFGGEKGIDILDAMEDNEVHRLDALYNVAKKLYGADQGWNEFIHCAYLYAYNKGMKAAQRASS